MIEVICYKNKLLPVGFVTNSYEADLLFTGLVIQDGSDRRSLKYPFDYVLYGADDFLIKDDHGRSYLIDATNTVYGTRSKLMAHVSRCLEAEYYEYFIMTGQDHVVVDYDLSGVAGYTIDSIRESVIVFEGGVKMYTDESAFQPWDMSKFKAESPNIIRFNRPRDETIIEVFIFNKFMPS